MNDDACVTDVIGYVGVESGGLLRLEDGLEQLGSQAVHGGLSLAGAGLELAPRVEEVLLQVPLDQAPLRIAHCEAERRLPLLGMRPCLGPIADPHSGPASPVGGNVVDDQLFHDWSSLVSLRLIMRRGLTLVTVSC